MRGAGAALPHGDLKGREVDLPQSALIHHGVHGHAAQFLAVDGEVLGAGVDALALDAPDVARRHLAGEVGVLGKIFKVAAAEGAALDVEAGPQLDVDALGGGFFPQGLAHVLAEIGVPAVCHGGGRGEAGGGQRGVQAQMVPRPGLPPDAVGAVRTDQGGHPRAGQVPGLPLALAAEQGTFFFQRQGGKDFLIGFAVHRWFCS